MSTEMFNQPTTDREIVHLELALTISPTPPQTSDASRGRGSRILATGSRSWTDHATIRAALADAWSPEAVLVSGACPRGADALCEACWLAWGDRIERHPADWDHLSPHAGFVRNAQMVAAGADLCLAFIHRSASPSTRSSVNSSMPGDTCGRHNPTYGTARPANTASSCSASAAN